MDRCLILKMNNEVSVNRPVWCTSPLRLFEINYKLIKFCTCVPCVHLLREHLKTKKANETWTTQTVIGRNRKREKKNVYTPSSTLHVVFAITIENQTNVDQSTRKIQAMCTDVQYYSLQMCLHCCTTSACLYCATVHWLCEEKRSIISSIVRVLMLWQSPFLLLQLLLLPFILHALCFASYRISAMCVENRCESEFQVQRQG